jgi:hypothetical protein
VSRLFWRPLDTPMNGGAIRSLGRRSGCAIELSQVCGGVAKHPGRPRPPVEPERVGSHSTGRGYPSIQIAILEQRRRCPHHSRPSWRISGCQSPVGPLSPSYLCFHTCLVHTKPLYHPERHVLMYTVERESRNCQIKPRVSQPARGCLSVPASDGHAKSQPRSW